MFIIPHWWYIVISKFLLVIFAKSHSFQPSCLLFNYNLHNCFLISFLLVICDSFHLVMTSFQAIFTPSHLVLSSTRYNSPSQIFQYCQLCQCIGFSFLFSNICNPSPTHLTICIVHTAIAFFYLAYALAHLVLSSFL